MLLADQDELPRLLRRLAHCLHVGHVQGHRLLDQQGAAGAQGVQGLLPVHRGRRGEVEHVRLQGVERGSMVGQGRAPSSAASASALAPSGSHTATTCAPGYAAAARPWGPPPAPGADNCHPGHAMPSP